MRALFLTQTAEHGPSSRYRVYQLLPELEKLGIHATVSPGAGGSLFARARGTWRQRQKDLQRLDRFDVVFVQKGVFPGLTAFFEKRIARCKPFVFDFDDTVWLPREGGNPLLRTLHHERTVQTILRRATAVIAGNEFLAAYSRQFNSQVTVVPTAVDVGRYLPANNSATIGWIGSRTTLPYLKSLQPVLQELNVKPLVIAAGDPAALGFPVDFREWRLDTELADLSQIGVGVAPLSDTPWERGKCGVKVLQYMACGIPVVASPVGAQKELVRDGVNGFLAHGQAEWTARLQQLRNDAALRARLGAAGRAMVEKQFDIKIAAEKVTMVLRSVKR